MTDPVPKIEQETDQDLVQYTYPEEPLGKES